MYVVGVGESPMSIAGALSGDCNRYGELLLANPHKPLAHVHGRVTFAVLVAGEFLNVPRGWDRLRPHRFAVLESDDDSFLGAGSGDTLGTNQGLHPGESITSPDGNVSLTLQPDGDLVIKKNSDGSVLWHSGTAGRRGVIAWMDHDGNLRVEAAGGESHKLWDNGAHGHADARARIEDTGNLFVWDGANHQIWDAGASLARPNPVPGGHGAAHTDFGGIDHDLKNLSRDLQHFSKDLVKDVKQFGPMILSEVQGLVSLIPGIGTGISAAIGLAMALLEGGSPIVIAIRTAYGAIPIPPGIRNITDPIVDGSIHFAENPKDFTDVAIKTIRDQVPAGLPREVFDTLVKIIIKHQPILKVAAGVIAEVAQQIPGVQNIIAAMPPVGTILPSIRQIAPAGVHIDVANIPNLIQAAQAQVQNPLDPQALATVTRVAQQRYQPLHALAVMTSVAQLAHKVGGPAATVAVLQHPLQAPAQIITAVQQQHPNATAPAALTPAPIPNYPPSAPVPAGRLYLPYMHSRVVGHSAMEGRAYPPYAHRGYPPHAGARSHGLHGTVGECAPDCKRWGAAVEMDHRMAQVANMLLTARKAQSTVSTGPDGILYQFERTDDGITARPCLD